MLAMVSVGLRDDGKRGRRRNVQGRPQRGYKVRKQALVSVSAVQFCKVVLLAFQLFVYYLG